MGVNASAAYASPFGMAWHGLMPSVVAGKDLTPSISAGLRAWLFVFHGLKHCAEDLCGVKLWLKPLTACASGQAKGLEGLGWARASVC